MKLGAIVCFILVLGSVAAFGQTFPNIVLFLADDLGRDWVSVEEVAENPVVETPNIDSLAATGVRFTHGIVSPTCSSTRYWLNTGRWGHRSGIGHALTPEDGNACIAPSEETLAKILAGVGYATAAIGKAHLCGAVTGAGDDYMRDLLGFSHYYGYLNTRADRPINPYEARLTEDGVTEEEAVPGRYFPSAFRDHAISWMESPSEPFFLYYALALPHSPYVCPPPEEVSCDPLGSDLDKKAAMVAFADKVVGEIVAAAPEHTIFVFIGDNGTENRMARPPVLPDRAKRTLYQGGINVPFIVTAPRLVPHVSDALVSAVDILPTLAEFLGVTPSAEIDGISFLDSLRTGSELERMTISEDFRPNGDPALATEYSLAAMDGRYKIIIDQDGNQELYDLDSDPWESTDLLEGPLSAEQRAARRALVDYVQPIWEEWFF